MLDTKYHLLPPPFIIDFPAHGLKACALDISGRQSQSVSLLHKNAHIFSLNLKISSKKGGVGVLSKFLPLGPYLEQSFYFYISMSHPLMSKELKIRFI